VFYFVIPSSVSPIVMGVILGLLKYIKLSHFVKSFSDTHICCTF
jgi:hypothetical protein